MKINIFKTGAVILVSLLFLGFSASDRITSRAHKVKMQGSGPVLVHVLHRIWGTSAVTSGTDAAGIKTMTITFGADNKHVFYVKNTPTSKTIYETDGAKRALLLDKTAGTVIVTENGNPASFNDKAYQDIFIAAAIDISGNVNYFPHSLMCSSTILAIYPQKSLAVDAVQTYSTSYQKAHPDCSQVGEIKTACVWGDSGCVAFTAMLCTKTDCK